MSNELDSPNEFNKLTVSQKQILLNWCSNINKIKSINHGHSSYGLKHIFENSKDGFYITNGAFKGAMLKCNFDYRLTEPLSCNWCFNISEKSIKELQNLNNR